MNGGISRETVASAASREGRGSGLRPRSLRLNAVAWTFSNLTYFGVIFVITPIAIQHLGTEGWGIWQLVGATVVYAHLLNLSLGAATQYQVAFRSASGDYAELATIFTNVRLYLFLAGAALLALLFLAGRDLVASLVLPHQLELAWSALAVALVLTSVDLQTRLAGSVLIGLQRNDLYAIFQVLGAALLFLAVLLGFRSGMGLRGFAGVMTMGPMFAALCSWVTYRRLLPPECLRVARPSWRLFREMVLYSLSTILYTAGAVVLYQTMKFIAAWRCGGPEAAGQMGLAISLAQAISVVFTPAVAVLQSRVGQLHGEGRLEGVSPLLERTLVALGLLLVPSVVFLMVDAGAIFRAWVGHTEAGAALGPLTNTTRLLFLGHAFYIAALPFYFVMLGVGQHRRFGVGMFAVAVLNTALGWLGASALPRIEMLAAVYGMLMLVLVLGVTAPAGLRRFPVSVGLVLRRGLAAPLSAAAPGAIAVALRPRLGRPLLDVAVDAALFTALCLPGLEFARRRFGLPLGFGLRA